VLHSPMYCRPASTPSNAAGSQRLVLEGIAVAQKYKRVDERIHRVRLPARPSAALRALRVDPILRPSSGERPFGV